MAAVRIDSDLPTLRDLLPRQSRVQRTVLGAVEDLAEVGELLRLGELLGSLVDGRLVDVAEGHDVLGADAAGVAPSAAAGADDGDVEFVVEVCKRCLSLFRMFLSVTSTVH